MIGPLFPIAGLAKAPPVDAGGTPLKGWQNISEKELGAIYRKKQGTLNTALRLDHYLALDPDDDAAIAYCNELDSRGLLPPTVCWETWRGRTVRLYRAESDALRRAKPVKGMLLEVRCGQGQYVIVPPSKVTAMFSYKWINDPMKHEVAVLPDVVLQEIYTKLGQSSSGSITDGTPEDDGVNTQVSELWKGLTKGGRHNSTCILAGSLLARHVSYEAVVEIMRLWNQRNTPPLTDEELLNTIKSLNVSELRKKFVGDKSMSQEIKEWVMATNGTFNAAELYRDLNLITAADKKNCLNVLLRMRDDNLIVSVGSKRGTYRLLDDTMDDIDYMNADPSNILPIVWPLGLQRGVNIYPKNIVIVAGTSNAGKTAFLLNVAKDNIDKLPITYFSSEMGAEELRVRLSKFDVPIEFWNKIEFFDRCGNFADVIRPNNINIIDYVEITEDFANIAKDIAEVFKVLDSGIAIIAIQKKAGAMLGRGAEFSMEKARLYVSLDNVPGKRLHRLTIVKAKNWCNPEMNPNGMHIDFKLVNGCKFLQTGQEYD